MTLPSPEWFDEAVCAQVDANLWFPDKGKRGSAAKAICRTCPVIDACLAHALADPSIQGIWAATSEKERAKLRREAANA